jgi:hypothetical protein
MDANGRQFEKSDRGVPDGKGQATQKIFNSLGSHSRPFAVFIGRNSLVVPAPILALVSI